MTTDKDDRDIAMLKILGDAITNVSGIDRKAHRRNSDEQFDKLRDLECDVFHFGFFGDLIAGDTKAEGKAVLNNIMSDELHKVNDVQLRLTSYIFYKALLSIQTQKIAMSLGRKSKIVTKERIDKADAIARQVADILLKSILNIGDNLERGRKQDV